jgi:hypothetical protein
VLGLFPYIAAFFEQADFLVIGLQARPDTDGRFSGATRGFRNALGKISVWSRRPRTAIASPQPIKMGQFVIPLGVSVVAWIVAGVIVALNVKLLYQAPWSALLPIEMMIRRLLD